MKAKNTLLTLFVLSQLTACAVASVDDDTMLGAAGSPSASGGSAPGSGGAVASGGVSSGTGGSFGSGGALVGVGGGASSGGSNTGGDTATGGVSSTGGSTASGGATTGGTTATGGEPATGGSSGSCSVPAWDASKAYPGNGTQVSLDGTVYENCYYANAGDDPSKKNDGNSCGGQPWKVVGPC